jgi:hypothetical protein
MEPDMSSTETIDPRVYDNVSFAAKVLGLSTTTPAQAVVDNLFNSQDTGLLWRMFAAAEAEGRAIVCYGGGALFPGNDSRHYRRYTLKPKDRRVLINLKRLKPEHLVLWVAKDFREANAQKLRSPKSLNPVVRLPRGEDAQTQPRSSGPTLVDMSKNLYSAMAEWAKAGFVMATEDVVADRKAICVACPEWVGDGYLGMGKCKKCGCSGIKLRFATSKCPLGKWNAVNNS